MKTTCAVVLTVLIVAGICAGPCPASSIGPFTLSNADSTSTIRFRFAGQLRMQYESHDHGPDNERTENLFSEARRIRPAITGDFGRHGLSFKLHLSMAPGSIELMDFQFEYEYWRGHRVRVGQFKIPFTRYRIQSFQRLTFADWSLGTKYFGAERQMGLSFHNGYGRPPTWGYAVGVFTGVNARAAHAVGLAGFFGEDVGNPSDLSDPASRPEYHPELVAHLSYNHGGIDVASDSDPDDGGLRFSAALSGAWDLDPKLYEDITTRVASEVLVKFHGASLSGIGYGGFVDHDAFDQAHPHRNSLLITGGLVQGAYRFADSYEFSIRYAVIDFDDKLVSRALNRALRIIREAEDKLADAPEYERDDAQTYLNEVNTRYGGIGFVYKIEEITVGMNFYIDGHSLKWQSDAGWILYSRSDEDRIDFVARSQFQLAF